MSQHPFQPGVRVAVCSGGRFGRAREWREDFVHKVHKNGNFTLKSDPKQQWHTYSDRASNRQQLLCGRHGKALE